MKAEGRPEKKTAIGARGARGRDEGERWKGLGEVESETHGLVDLVDFLGFTFGHSTSTTYCVMGTTVP